MNSVRIWLPMAAAVSLLCGCGGSAMVKYGNGADAKAGENTFVIPRTVVKIEYEVPRAAAAVAGGRDATATPAPAQAAPKDPALTFTPVPVVTNVDGSNLPIYSITDDTNNGFAWVPTTVTSVTYADLNIIQSIGTQITDNRKAVIDAAFGIFGTVAKGAGFMSEQVQECKDGIEKFQPFVLTDFTVTGDQTQRIPNNPCWGYRVYAAAGTGDTSVGAFSVSGSDAIPLGTKVGWFPYPACKNYRILVVRCSSSSASALCNPAPDAPSYSNVVAVSDGTSYRRQAFPPKGKITMHANFCVADVTSDPSPLGTNWEIVNQVINNTKTLLQPASPSTAKK